MKTLLWIGDAACDSGFAKCTHETLKTLSQYFQVIVLGLNHRGDPHEFLYKIYPARNGGDYLGVGRVVELCGKHKPDVVVIQNDPWNIPAYVKQFDRLLHRPLIVGAIAIDGMNTNGKNLNGLDHAIFWTEFGRKEAITGGFTKTSGVIPLGVDLEVFKEGDKLAARKALGIDPVPDDAFIVLNVGRNQPRKRLDLTVEYFATWIHKYRVNDAYLYLHVCPTGDVGVNLDQLCGYYGLQGRVVLASPGVYHGATEAEVVQTIQAADVRVSTSAAEGWDLPSMEAMACGVPCLLPNHSAYSDWAKDAAHLVPCSGRIVSWGGPNVIGQIPDKTEFVTALNAMYQSPRIRGAFAMRGLNRVREPEYRWSAIGERFKEEIDKVLSCPPARS